MNTYTTHELPEDLLRLAGYDVSEDSDQPGLFVWTRREHNQIVEGCDMSLDGEDDAWQDVREMVIEVLTQDAALTADRWNALSAEERAKVIVEQFG